MNPCRAAWPHPAARHIARSAQSGPGGRAPPTRCRSVAPCDCCCLSPGPLPKRHGAGEQGDHEQRCGTMRWEQRGGGTGGWERMRRRHGEKENRKGRNQHRTCLGLAQMRARALSPSLSPVKALPLPQTPAFQSAGDARHVSLLIITLFRARSLTSLPS